MKNNYTTFNRSNKLGFAFYDFSNSGYVIIFQTFLFPIFLASILSNSSLKPAEIWGWAVSISVIIAIIFAPIIGRIADRKNKTTPFTVLVIGVGILSFIAPLFISSRFFLLIFIFIIFNAMFELTQSLYNAFLKEIAKSQEEINKLSTFAWGFGYLGGILFALIYLLLNHLGFKSEYILSTCSVLYLIFSIFPIYIFKKVEHKSSVQVTAKRELLNFKSLLKFKTPIDIKPLIIYWIIADCVAAIMYHSSLFSKTELNISETTIGILMLGVQLLAFPITWYAGKIANKFGLIKAIKLSLYVWIAILLILYFSKGLTDLIIVMVLTSLVIGSTQSLLRAHFAGTIGPEFSGEGFGFFGIANKSASLISPALVALVVGLTNSIRPAFFLLSILLILAIYLSRFLYEHDSVK